jgi:hypothetical protein
LPKSRINQSVAGNAAEVGRQATRIGHITVTATTQRKDASKRSLLLTSSRATAGKFGGVVANVNCRFGLRLLTVFMVTLRFASQH